jgi:hypothetical protein
MSDQECPHGVSPDSLLQGTIKCEVCLAVKKREEALIELLLSAKRYVDGLRNKI